MYPGVSHPVGDFRKQACRNLINNSLIKFTLDIFRYTYHEFQRHKPCLVLVETTTKHLDSDQKYSVLKPSTHLKPSGRRRTLRIPNMSKIPHKRTHASLNKTFIPDTSVSRVATFSRKQHVFKINSYNIPSTVGVITIIATKQKNYATSDHVVEHHAHVVF